MKNYGMDLDYVNNPGLEHLGLYLLFRCDGSGATQLAD